MIKKFAEGERVALVGRSGAGKTTLVKLMLGMLKPDRGEILFNGVDVSTLDSNSLYGRIGVIMQENILFNMSIRENLLMACRRADIETLDRACKLACIDDFIRSLPDGYDTLIGERGVKLSGGQKQRLVLARLLLRDVEVIIFDEATSALDQESESTIFDAINALGRDTTCIVVAHRKSSIDKCDRQIVIR